MNTPSDSRASIKEKGFMDTPKPQTESQPERQTIPYKEAVAMLPDGKNIHTFRSGGFCLIGADWKRRSVLAAMKKHGCELSGPMATRMNHELVLHDPSPLFIETKKKPVPNV